VPGSLPNPVLYFPAKVAIYSLAGWVLNKVYKAGPNPLLFGILRVAIGFGLGLLLLIAITASRTGPRPNNYDEYIWLIFTRIFVWTVMIWFFYERKSLSLLRFFIVVIGGTLLSFGIDVAFSFIDKEFSGMFSIPMC
jgi:hypothetical protein